MTTIMEIIERGQADDNSRVNAADPLKSYISDQYHFDVGDLDRVQRRLKQRHVQMIAIAGTIGTGLFLGFGQTLGIAGPLGTLIAYILVSTVAYASLCALGEMTSHAPISGTFPHFAARWVDPAFGFAVGWNYYISTAIAVPVEITAAVIVLTYWNPTNKNAWIPTLTLCLGVCLINVFGVQWFGESEFVFSMIKVILITGLIIAGLVIDLGGGPDHQRIGFEFWENPGALNVWDHMWNAPLGHFYAILAVIPQAGFSLIGMELCAVAASETESPRRNIAKAIRRVFYRIVIFYMLGTLIMGMIVPFNEPELLKETGNVAQSPWVIAMKRAGIKALPGLVNAAVFTSAVSACSSFLFSASRVLYGLALRRQAPYIFTRCTSRGLPLTAVITSGCFSGLAFLGVRASTARIFTWLGHVATLSGFITWWALNLTFIRFYYGKEAQGIDRRESVYYNPFQPWLSFWGIFWASIFIVLNGFTIFFSFNISDFMAAYVGLLIFIVLFLSCKLTGTPFWQTKDMDFVTGIPSVEETEFPGVPPRTTLGKVANILF